MLCLKRYQPLVLLLFDLPLFAPALSSDMPSKSASSPTEIRGLLTSGEYVVCHFFRSSSNLSVELFTRILFHILLLNLGVRLCGFAPFGIGNSVSTFLFGGSGVPRPHVSCSSLPSSTGSMGGRTRSRILEWCSHSMLTSRRLDRGRPQTFRAGIFGLALMVMVPFSR